LAADDSEKSGVADDVLAMRPQALHDLPGYGLFVIRRMADCRVVACQPRFPALGRMARWPRVVRSRMASATEAIRGSIVSRPSPTTSARQPGINLERYVPLFAAGRMQKLSE
jgi:hypothetical protein